MEIVNCPLCGATCFTTQDSIGVGMDAISYTPVRISDDALHAERAETERLRELLRQVYQLMAQDRRKDAMDVIAEELEGAG